MLFYFLKRSCSINDYELYILIYLKVLLLKLENIFYDFRNLLAFNYLYLMLDFDNFNKCLSVKL